ncbi:sigma-70 family RNA polymerase sigma factor [Aquirufa rosea]|uniref:RNA polymerase sigma factor n=1 Tax=Aquirufa rosea TaxID=2509241 RepID=A0A4Q1BYV5_9BACT|nr:sigma-70 family RNA polymerase sigma factor [Aquirufa rosea]
MDVQVENEIDPSPHARQIFEKEFMPHLDAMYNFALRLTNDEDDAQDLVQDTCLKAYRFINSFEPGTYAKAWLFRILKNNFINDYRKKSRGPSKVEFEWVEQSFAGEDDPEPSHQADLHAETVNEMLGDEITKAIQALPVDFRMIIILCDLEEFSYEEMAKILNIPIGTVRSRLHRARALLKDSLATYAKSKGYKADTLSGND